MTEHDADYTYHLAVGSHALAQRLTQLETDKVRKERKTRVLERKTDLLVATYPRRPGRARADGAVQRSPLSPWATRG